MKINKIIGALSLFLVASCLALSCVKGDGASDAGKVNTENKEEKPAPQPEPETNPQPEPQPDPQPGPEPAPQPEPQPEPQPQPEPEPEPQPQPQPDPLPQPDPQPEPQPDPQMTKSNIVVFDFTGQSCTSCTGTIERLEEAKKYLSPNLIAVALHSAAKSTSQFICDEVAYYNKHHNIGQGPKCVLNNISSTDCSLPELANAVNRPPLLESSLNLNSENGRIEVNFDSRSIKGQEDKLSGVPLNVLFLVIENNVVGRQSRLGDNYNHMHILRGALNGLWGEKYELGTKYIRSFALPAKVKNRSNCEVVAIVLKAEGDKEFIDAVKVEVN